MPDEWGSEPHLLPFGEWKRYLKWYQEQTPNGLPRCPLFCPGRCPNQTEQRRRYYCWWCERNLSGKANWPGHLGWMDTKEFYWSPYMGKWIKKPTPPVSGGNAEIPVSKGDKEKYEALLEMMTETRYEDGTERKTSTITLFCDQDGLKACLSDRDANRTAWATAESFAALLATLERGIREDRLEWRTARPWTPQKGKGGRQGR